MTDTFRPAHHAGQVPICFTGQSGCIDNARGVRRLQIAACYGAEHSLPTQSASTTGYAACDGGGRQLLLGRRPYVSILKAYYRILDRVNSFPVCISCSYPECARF